MKNKELGIEKHSCLRYGLIIMLLLFTQSLSYSQQLTSSSLYNYNRLNYNPAYAGASDMIPISLHVRQQWIGFEDAPSSQYLSSHGFIEHDIGIGGVLFNNITGPTRQTGMKVAFAKHFEIIRGHWLSMGISAELYQNLFEAQSLQTNTPNDPILTDEVQQKLAPDASTGIFLYSEDYFAGLSVVNLIESRWDLFKTSPNFDNPLDRTFYLTGGYVLPLTNEDFTYIPSLIVLKTIGLPFQIEVCNKLSYNNLIWGAASFRSNLDAIVMLGIQIQFFELAYSYDLSFNEIRNYNHGSHEILVRFNIQNHIRQERHIRHSNQSRYPW